MKNFLWSFAFWRYAVARYGFYRCQLCQRAVHQTLLHTHTVHCN